MKKFKKNSLIYMKAINESTEINFIYYKDDWTITKVSQNIVDLDIDAQYKILDELFINFLNDMSKRYFNISDILIDLESSPEKTIDIGDYTVTNQDGTIVFRTRQKEIKDKIKTYKI